MQATHDDKLNEHEPEDQSNGSVIFPFSISRSYYNSRTTVLQQRQACNMRSNTGLQMTQGEQTLE